LIKSEEGSCGEEERMLEGDTAYLLGQKSKGSCGEEERMLEGDIAYLLGQKSKDHLIWGASAFPIFRT